MIYSINITAQHLDLVGHALGKLPHDTVAGLIANLRSQAIAQQEAAAAKAEKASARVVETPVEWKDAAPEGEECALPDEALPSKAA